MVGTIFSILIAFFIFFSRVGSDIHFNMLYAGVVFIVVATLFLILPAWAVMSAWGPVQHGEQYLTPRLSHLYLKDRYLNFANGILIIFSLFSFVVAFDFLFIDFLPKALFLAFWIIFLGISIDALHYILKRTTQYLDPIQSVYIFSAEAKRCIMDVKEVELCQWIESLSEVAIRALSRISLSLCNQVCDELQRVMRIFFESYKTIGYNEKKADAAAEGGDAVSYTLLFLLQRYEMINDRAVEMKLEPVCSHLVTDLSKVIVSSAKFDLTLPSYPLFFLGRIVNKSQSHGLLEVGPKALYALLEVANQILTDVDITYVDLEEPFKSLIVQMNEITREMFRQNKSLSVKVLKQPFLDLRELFKTGKAVTHRDTQAILTAIDNVLGEYDALDNVLRAVPPINT